MLQQTQVNTVIPYFKRFMERFPDVSHLAAAEQDLVLHYWSGLGYYARARNLHKAAQIICENYQGAFPQDLRLLESLPGIGHSTAGAILALAFGLKASILDGNVKRVLARFYALAEYPGSAKAQKQLWQWADEHTPASRVADYTQAIMDFGATLCTRTQPQCVSCPLAANCRAHQINAVTHFPRPRPKKKLPVKHTLMLLVQNQNKEVLLLKRPNIGIWGGLWSLPECAEHRDINQWCLDNIQVLPSRVTPGTQLSHVFTHFRLEIEALSLTINNPPLQLMESEQMIWYSLHEPQQIGIASPVARLLSALRIQR